MNGFDHANQARDKTHCLELAYGAGYLKLEEEKLDETAGVEALLKRKPPGTKQLDQKTKQEESPKPQRNGQEGNANP